MGNNRKIDRGEVIRALLMMGISLLIVFGVSIALGNFTKIKQGSVTQQNIRSVVSCPPDNLSYQALIQNSGKVLKLISKHTNMSAQAGRFVDSEVIVAKSETKTSKVACGYLFVKAGTDSTEDEYGALRAWENIYINPNMFGGHINPKSAIVQNDGEKYSEYVYSLNKIEYRKSRDDRSILTADWSYLFNVSSEITFQIGLNTEDTTGFVDEISIAYKCWNPETGEENDGCKLQIK